MLITFLIVTSGRVQADPQLDIDTVELATIDYPPLMGGREAILSELASAAFAAVGIKVNYRVYSLPRVVRAVATNAVAGALGTHNWFYYDDAKLQISYIPIYAVNIRLFYLKSHFPQGLDYQELRDLQGYKIGYIRGGALLPEFAKANIEPELVRTLHQNVEKVYAERDDMFVATELGGWAVIKQHFPEDVSKFAQAEDPLFIDEGDIIFSHKYKHLQDIFWLGFQMIKENGQYLKVVEKYYGKHQVPAYLQRFIESP
ncbi:substrate-binding periplasmic protein [Agarivorans sp. QJM3NY_33]|uniref:substrate-binding periplasmic protein n=1 Tax=Agarivorans sp. QJM3NY_33 TaxID=3421432 RepID=UPI003D7EB943